MLSHPLSEAVPAILFPDLIAPAAAWRSVTKLAPYWLDWLTIPPIRGLPAFASTTQAIETLQGDSDLLDLSSYSVITCIATDVGAMQCPLGAFTLAR